MLLYLWNNCGGYSPNTLKKQTMKNTQKKNRNILQVVAIRTRFYFRNFFSLSNGYAVLPTNQAFS